MIKFEIKKSNYRTLPQLAENLRKSKIKEIELSITEQREEVPQFSEIMPFLYQILDYELFFKVRLKNIPFCVINPEATDHIFTSGDNSLFKKSKECRTCFWNERCLGFSQNYLAKYGGGEICPLPDLPWEVMIEVDPRCNFNCHFCFNQISFAKNNREVNVLNKNYVKKIIDGLVKAKVNIVRFTGGEPILRKDIFELLKYAKNKGLETRLNTNGSLINLKIAKKLKGIVDNVLIPIESYNNQEESKITGYNNSLKRKLEAIKLLKKEQIPIVRAGTVLIKENILHFDKLNQFIFNLPLDEWELYRPIPVSKDTDLNSKIMNFLADKLIDLKKRTGKMVFIANALPFCAINDLNKMNSISKGAFFDDGHSRLVIDPRGFVKPDYFIDENLGSPLDILNAWHHPFVKKIRSLNYLPQKCQNCSFLYKCRGGSRQAAKMVYNNYWDLDPLGRLS